MGAEFPPVARAFDAAEGDAGIGGGHPVDEDAAGLQVAGLGLVAGRQSVRMSWRPGRSTPSVSTRQRSPGASGVIVPVLYTVAGNLGRRRTHFATRTAFAVRNREELLAARDEFAESPSNVSTTDDGERRIAMVFAGQGTQWTGCGRGLYDADPVFRRAVDAVEDHWWTHSDVSLRDA